jgi:hypothetical protein
MDAGDAMERGERAPLLPEVTAGRSRSLPFALIVSCRVRA